MAVSCEVCGVAMPLARGFAQKGAALALGGLLGTAATRSWWGGLLIGLGSVAAVYAAEQLMRPVCGHCELRHV